jgi:hypothetical protein
MADTRILIVEDEAIVAEDIAYRLQTMGYTIAGIVASGEAAIAALTQDIAAESALNLVLMDIMLRGDMDGVEAAQQIRTEFNVPVVYLTANADETTLRRAKQTEPFGYLLKPFKEKELKAAIEIALSRHQAEQEVQQALAHSEAQWQQMQQLSVLKSQFLSMASHELRAPLSVIKMATEILQHYDRQLSEDAKQRHFQRITVAMDSLQQLVDDVLMLGQADCHRFTCSFEPIDLVHFCQEVVQTCEESATTPCLLEFIDRWTDAAAVEPAPACSDPKLLWHLLHNLLSNAIKYSPQGGTVSLTLSRTADAVWFEVQDQGIGIPPAEQASLFEPFRRASNVGKIPGTGLGLAIVKRSVDLLGGDIAVRSAIGQGTTFMVKLPLQPPSSKI